MLKRRKKTCPQCGQYLWLRDFYRSKEGWTGTYCKVCTRQNKREEYARNRKKPDGIFKGFKTDQLIEHRGASRRIYWTPYMIERLTRNYATTKNEDLALDLNVSPRTVVRKARELGLKKSKGWLSAHILANCKQMAFINRYCGNSGQFKKGERNGRARNKTIY